ncbi:MAG TPA: helix-turn-helix transcriptional regulator [Ferrovibrio sp.]|uniref:helix-turn-helix domain-containing protein n=1 Tax=Ferrovibrio sp. TaxID=1917215 RepID=UPI002ECFB3E3
MSMIQNTRFDKELMAKLRKEAGAFLKELRNEAGLTQLKLSHTLGYSYYSYVSQIEGGVNRVPSEAIEDWARALNVNPSWLALSLMKYYDPFSYELLAEHISVEKRL